MPAEGTRLVIEESQAPALGTVYDNVCPIKAAPFFDAIYSVRPANLVCQLQPGFRQVSGAPLQELDSVVRYQLWSAVTGATITRAQDPLILGNLPHYVATRGSDEGLQTTLGSNLTNYSIAVLFKLTDMSANNCIFGVGTSSLSRLAMIVQPSGTIEVQHGTGDRKISTTGVIALNTWYSVVATFNMTSKAINIYVDQNPTTVLTDTFTADPPTIGGTTARLGGSADNNIEFHGKIAMLRVWNAQLSSTTERNTLINAMNGLKAL